MLKVKGIGLALFVLVAGLSMPLQAALITFVHTGTGTANGTLNGVAFTTSRFEITATGDTATRQSFGGGFSIDHTAASITIDGLGTFAFITPTRTFFNDNNDTVGFSRAGIAGSDLYNGPTSATLNGWDMLTSIGPIAGNGSLLQWSTPVNTSGGVLFFANGGVSATFVATTGAVPEPSTIAMFGVGVLGIAFSRLGWRRRKAV